jgi:hypothetical protein
MEEVWNKVKEERIPDEVYRKRKNINPYFFFIQDFSYINPDKVNNEINREQKKKNKIIF